MRDPDLPDGVRRSFRLELRRPGPARVDVDREIRFHLEERAAQLIAQGLDSETARREALTRFGDPALAASQLGALAGRHQTRLAARDRWGTFLDDFRYVIRALRRSPGFAATIVVTLAIGIGLTATMFGIIDRLLLRGPAHVNRAGQLERLYSAPTEGSRSGQASAAFGYVTYTILRDHASALEDVAAYAYSDGILGVGRDAERIIGQRATWNFFGLLGVRPVAGRFFTAEEDLPPTGEKVVVLSQELWERRFGADTTLIGRTVPIGGEPYRVVGVAPAGFTGAELTRVDYWTPMSLSRTTDDWPTTWNAQWLQVVARRRSEVSAGMAADEATRLHREAYGGENPGLKTARLDLRPIGFTFQGREPAEYPVSRWLTGVSLTVLLIACANVANLMLARGTRRRREVAVRLAVGIPRWRLLRLLMAEGLVLALLGAAGGLALAGWVGAAVRAVLLPDIAWQDGVVNPRVLALALGLAVATGVVVGIAPVLQGWRLDLAASLRSGSVQAGSRRSRTRTALVLAQAALSFVLLIGAGLFVRSVNRVRALDLGFEPDRVLAADLYWPRVARTSEEAAAERTRRRNVFLQAVGQLAGTPGVEHAAIAVGTPFGGAFGVDLWVPGRDSVPNLGGGGPFISAVTPGYFAATGIQMVEGRAFAESDGEGTERVTIVNEPMARALWPGESALGRCLQVFDPKLACARIVGVVTEVRRFALREPPAMQYYVPFGQEVGIGGSVVLVRPAGDAERFAPTLQRVLLDVDAGLLFPRVRLMQDAIDPLTRSWRLGATLFTLFGAVALLIAGVGLYSVIACMVAERAPEFGVRLALGATAPRMVFQVLRHGMGAAALGIAIGLVLALVAGRFLAPLLFDTSPRDPAVLGGAALMLLAVALVACALPARRAAGVDPAAALRSE